MLGLKIKIYGRVQGVGFRFFAKQWAEKLNIVGFVLNEKDGSVYIQAYGKKENLEKFLNNCFKGTSFSKVLKIDYEWIKNEDIFYKNFEIRFNNKDS
jgi:acylphosphatase